MTQGTTTTTTTGSAPVPTYQQIRKAMDALAGFREPFAEYMDKQGMSPEQGYVLVLSEQLRASVATCPSYVRFSPLTEKVLIVHEPTAIDPLTPSRVSFPVRRF